MKLFLVSQSVNNGWDIYDSMVVAANSSQQAKFTHPSEFYVWNQYGWSFKRGDGVLGKIEGSTGGWCMPNEVTVEYLGEAADRICEGVICTSFNAG